MPETGYFAVFLIGLLGGVHCVGMCGGIVSALSGPQPGRDGAGLAVHLAYNLGRITTYLVTGGIVGALGSASLLFNEWLPVQISLYVLANVMLVALGLYLCGITRVLQPLERLGHAVWRRIQPLGKGLLPVRRWPAAYPVGLLWGLIPCGLTYSVLSAALVSGSAAHGAALMLAFGLGTLPNLLLAGMALVRLRSVTRHPALRIGSGLLVAAFGVYGLLHASELGGRLWQGLICEPGQGWLGVW